jgi:UDP:flavonoid glycosyltransferase YjiC (YdhE family)
MLATADRGAAPANALTAPYIPGYRAAKKARVVVSNGGSLSTAQALAAGRPFLGICSNMDQFLACQPLVEAGAGLMLPASQATAARVGEAVKALLENPRFAANARLLQPRFAPSLAPTRFRSWFERTLGMRAAA